MNEVHDRSSASDAAASGAADMLSDVLRSVRLTGSMLFLVEATVPWRSWAPPAEAFRRVVLPASQHLVSYHIVTRGRCWAGLRDAAPEPFDTGDVLVVPHGDAYFLADPLDAPPAYGPEEAVVFFRQMAAGELPSTIPEGGVGAPGTQFICGFLGCDVRPFNPVLAALPRMMHLRAASSSGDRMHHLIEFALCELRERSTGGQSVLLRLAELMFIEVVRRHLETMPDGADRLAGRPERCAGGAQPGADARRTGAPLDPRRARRRGGRIAFGAGRTLRALCGTAADAVPHALAHAAGDTPADRARREGGGSGCARSATNRKPLSAARSRSAPASRRRCGGSAAIANELQGGYPAPTRRG